jgi:vitamin B12 transporter
VGWEGAGSKEALFFRRESGDRFDGLAFPPSEGERRTNMPACLKNSAVVFVQIAFVLFVCVVVAPARAAATASLSGTITDSSGARIAGASVNLFNPTGLVRAVVSDGNGSFSLEALAAGNYVVEVSAEGFQKQSRHMRLEAAETLDIRLDVGGLHQDVTVIASDLPAVPAEVAKSISVITSDDLSKRDTVFLSDALSTVPALQLQQLGGPGHVASYRFRGMLPEHTAILLDGFRFHDAADNRNSARPLLSDLLLTGTDRVEVLRGAGSTLYGSNAIGGLVNVISSQASRPLEGYVSAEGGSLGLGQGTAGLAGRGRRAAYAVDLAHINYTRGEDPHDTYRITGGNGRTTFQLAPNATLFVKFAMSDSFAMLNQNPSPVPDLPPLPAGRYVYPAIPIPEPGATFVPQRDDPDYYQKNRLVLGALRLDYQPSAFWTQSFGYQSARSQRLYVDGPLASTLAPSRNNYDGATDELFWRSTIAVRRNDSLQLHLDWERTAFDQSAFGQRTQAQQRSFSIHASNQVRLFDNRLQVELAGGAAYYQLNTPSFSDSTGNPYSTLSAVNVPSSYNGDAAVSYLLPATNTKLRAHVGNGFRSPSLYERFASGGSGFYYGDPKLKPERSVFVDGGIDQYVFGNKLQASATYFFTHLRTIIDFGSTPQDPFNRFSGYINSSGGNARGVELTVAARPSARINFSASYTFTNSDQPSATSPGTTRSLGLADHQFNATVGVQPWRRLHLQLDLYAVSDHDFPLFGATFPSPTLRFPGYALANLTAGYVVHETEHTRLRWLLRVDNLLNREYFNGGFLEPKATARTGLRWEF